MLNWNDICFCFNNSKNNNNNTYVYIEYIIILYYIMINCTILIDIIYIIYI